MFCEYTQEQKELVLKLREETEMGLGYCIRALVHNNYDYDKALEELKERKKCIWI